MRVRLLRVLLFLAVFLSLRVNPAAAQAASQSALVAKAAVEPASAAEKPLPTTEEILEHYRAATGGSELWSTFTTRSTKGLYQTEDLSGFAGIEILEKAPNLSFRKTTFSNGIAIREICDGKSVWIEDAAGNRLELTGAALESRLQAARFGNRGDFLARSSPGRVLGIAQVGAHSTYVVSFRPQRTSPQRFILTPRADGSFAWMTFSIETTATTWWRPMWTTIGLSTVPTFLFGFATSSVATSIRYA